MDADLGLANVNVVLGVIPRYNLYHLIRKQKTMNEIIVDTSYGIQIIAGASGFSKIANLSEEERKGFIEELDELANADIIIIDYARRGLEQRDLLHRRRRRRDHRHHPRADRDHRRLRDHQDHRHRDRQPRPGPEAGGQPGQVGDRRARGWPSGSSTSPGQFLNLKVDYLGFVYDDPVVHTAVVRQKPFLVLDPKSKASICIDHIARRLENMDFKEGGGVSKFIRKFFGAQA